MKKAKKKGYTFEGWYKESSFKNRITTIPKGSKGNLTIYAKWKANKYTVRFHGNKATSGSMQEMKNLESLSADEEMWPHIDCRIQVNLDERLKKAQFELKGIENKMLDGTRAQLRKRAVQMEEMKSLCSRMEQAVLSIESWEKLYLMFMADMEIRRQSGMDDTFYLMEREDIRRKLQTCFEFTDIICRSLEERLRSSVRISVNNLGLLLAEHGFHFPKSLWNRTRTNIIYMGAIRLTEDMIEEINRYAAGIMFIEKHLHNIKLATDRVYRGQMELERLSGQSKT